MHMNFHSRAKIPWIEVVVVVVMLSMSKVFSKATGKNSSIKFLIDNFLCRQMFCENHLTFVRRIISAPLRWKVLMCDCTFCL